MSAICQKCLYCAEDNEIGQPCPHCKDGVIERAPEFKELVDELTEPMTCGRRFDKYFGGVPVHHDQREGRDHWDKFKRIDNRVCSFCGSLHPDDFFRLVHEAAIASTDEKYRDVVSIEGTDKDYKVYVNQPGVRNAHEGGIKFYLQHLPRKADGSIDVTEEQQKEFVEAKKRSRIRHDHYMDEMFPPRHAGPVN